MKFIHLLGGSLAIWVLGACATPQTLGTPERPPSAGEMEMGYQEAVDLGHEYVAQQGHSDVELHGAEHVRPNIWRVRFGLAPKGSGRLLDLYFDGAKRTLLKSELTDKKTPPATKETPT